MSLPVMNQHIYSILQPNHAKSIPSPRHCWAGNAQSGGGPGPDKETVFFIGPLVNLVQKNIDIMRKRT